MALQLQPLTQATHKGRRPYQEDRFFSFNMAEGLCFGVFDGHGGHQCAHLASELVPRLMADAMDGKPIPEVLSEVFVKLNAATAGMYEGSTASIAFIPNSADMVHVAVIGDSPVIVKTGHNGIWMAPEHNVRTNKEEAKAAEGRGGVISGGYLSLSWNGPGLQMARALGDVELSRVLSRIPDISSIPLGAGSFVLVCTDGALDPGHAETEESAEKVVALIESGSSAQAIVDRAIAIPTGDNVTAMLVRVEARADV